MAVGLYNTGHDQASLYIQYLLAVSGMHTDLIPPADLLYFSVRHMNTSVRYILSRHGHDGSADYIHKMQRLLNGTKVPGPQAPHFVSA